MADDQNVKAHKHIHMNFTKIIKTNVKKEDYDSYKQKFNNLPEYKRGTREKKGIGFKNENIKLEDFDIYKLQDYKDGNDKQISLYNQCSISSENIITKTFYIEEYPRDTTDPIISRVDVFWILSCDILLLNGGLDNAEEALKLLYEQLDGVIIEEVELEHDFLVWITCRVLRRNGRLRDDYNLMVKRIDKVNTANLNRNSGTSRVPRVIDVSHGEQAELSLPTIYGLVNDHEHASIGGEFNFRNDTINAKLTSKKGIHIYSRAVLKGKGYEDRCNITLPFIIDIINVLEEWNSLDNELRYPDKKYMDKMYKSFKEQIIECESNFKLLKEKYAKLRGEKNRC